MFFQRLMRRLRFFSLLVSSLLSRHGQRLVIFIVGAVVILASLIWLIKVIKPFKSSYTEAVIGSYAVEKLPPRVTKLVSVGLTSPNQKGEFMPELATWTTDESGKVYTFTLRDDLYWQDGQQIKAQDLVFAIEGVEIELLDQKTIRFELNEPYSPFPSLLSSPLFRKNTLIGVGSYQIKKIDAHSDLVNFIKLKSLKEDLPDINFYFYPNEQSALLAFKLGKVNAVSGVFNNSLDENWPSWNVSKKPAFNKLIAIFFNTQDSLLSKEARQALNYLLDRSNITQHLAYSPIEPNSWAFNPEVKHYETNTAKAEELAKDLNLKDQKLTLNTMARFEKLANQIAQNWQKLGINVEVKVITQPNNTDFQALLAGQELPLDPDQYTLWHSTQKTNITKISNPKIDKLLEDARKETDLQERKQKYFDFQKVLVDESPAIFLYHPDYYFISSKKAQNKIDQISSIYPYFNDSLE